MTLENNKDGAPELHHDINSSTSIDTVTEDLNNMAVLDDNTGITICASCGKGEEDDDNSLKFCGACKLVKYCNAACKKKHRTKHKKACERRVAELYDEKLFKDIEPEECPICMLPIPHDDKRTFKSCCGKNVCNGCVYAMKMSEEGGKVVCAFCRTLAPSSGKEEIIRLKKLADKGNAAAYFSLAGNYARGKLGLPQDRQKANELYLKAGELGSADAYYNLGNSYNYGTGVGRDYKNARHYYELAAIGGSPHARNNLGWLEECVGNYHRAYKHYMIAAIAGLELSLETVDLLRQLRKDL